MAGFDNNVVYVNGVRLEPSTSQDIFLMQTVSNAVSRINYSGNPNNNIAANPSSISHDPTTGNLWLKVSGTGTTTWKQIFAEPSASIVEITGNTGTATPDGSGNINVKGPNSALTGYSPWNVASGSTLTVNMPGATKWVVNATAGLGTHTTIQAAITAASSGDDVFITAGSYTENLTLKVGVNLVAFDADATTPNVTIIGTCTLTTAGTVSISGIRLQTNSAALLAVTGSAASIVNLNRCYLNCTNNTGITFSSSSASAIISLNYCFADIGTTGISLFTNTSAGTMYFKYTQVTNSGSTATASTISAGIVVLRHSELAIAITTSSTGSIDAEHSTFSGTNAAAITTAGTGGGTFHLCYFQSGSGSAVSIGTGTSVGLIACDLNSSNTNVVTGLGTLNATNLSFSGTSSIINPTTVTGTFTNLVNYKATKQPCFMAYCSSAVSNVTGDGTSYTINFGTTSFDQASNFSSSTTFTAPVTGRYLFTVSVLLQSCITASTPSLKLVTSGLTYDFGNNGTAFTGNNILTGSVIAAMSSGDTATVVTSVGGGAKTVGVYGAGSDPRTIFSGYLVA